MPHNHNLNYLMVPAGGNTQRSIAKNRKRTERCSANPVTLRFACLIKRHQVLPYRLKKRAAYNGSRSLFIALEALC